MKTHEYIQLDAHSLASGIKHEKWCADDVLDYALERMDEVNPLIHAFLAI